MCPNAVDGDRVTPEKAVVELDASIWTPERRTLAKSLYASLTGLPATGGIKVRSRARLGSSADPHRYLAEQRLSAARRPRRRP